MCVSVCGPLQAYKCGPIQPYKCGPIQPYKCGPLQPYKAVARYSHILVQHSSPHIHTLHHTQHTHTPTHSEPPLENIKTNLFLDNFFAFLENFTNFLFFNLIYVGSIYSDTKQGIYLDTSCGYRVIQMSSKKLSV